MIGVFFPFDGVMVMFITLAYFVCPERWLGGKYRLIEFFLVTVGVYFLAFMIYRLLFITRSLSPTLLIQDMRRNFCLGIVPWMCMLYFLVPVKWTGAKYEYLKFFLLSLGLYCLVFLGFKILFMRDTFLVEGAPRGRITLFYDLFWTLLVPWITVSHLVYPFRKVRRNRHVIFFSVLISVGLFASYFAVYFLVLLNNVILGPM